MGAGLQVMRATLDLTRKLDFVNSEGSVRIVAETPASFRHSGS